MCENCGCSDVEPARPARGDHDHAGLAHLDRLAERNRGFLRAKRVCAVNLLSFAGSGAAALVERTRRELGARRRVTTLNAADLERFHALHTHASAHAHEPHTAAEASGGLDAHAVAHALEELPLDGVELLLIENSGPAATQAVQDLGETVRVAFFSVRDGAFKPLKFPLFFAGAAAVALTDADAATAAGCDIEQARANVQQVAPAAVFIPISSATSPTVWYQFLEGLIERQHSTSNPKASHEQTHHHRGD